jgi:hypothetical protein
MADLSLMYRQLITITEGDAGIVDAGGGLFYKEFDITAANIKSGSTLVKSHVAESRIPTIPEPSLSLEHRGAFARIVSDTVLRVYWRGALAEDAEAGPEAFTVDVQLLDYDPLADLLLEIKFLQQRTLGELGVNQRQDLIVRDDAGNIVQYRSRTFTTKALAVASTPDIPDGEPREEGEMSRRTVYVDVDLRRNDRTGLISVLDSLMDTPGITVEE